MCTTRKSQGADLRPNLMTRDEARRIAVNIVKLPDLRSGQMINVPPGRPVKTNSPRTLERFHIYLLLVLGIALLGAGVTVIGFVTASHAAVGIGAGAIVAAGLIAVCCAVAGVSRLTVEEKSVPTVATSIEPSIPGPDPENRRPAWRPRTSSRIPD
jgi:hypothetical protein